MHIFPAKQFHAPHQYSCSSQGYGPVKIRHTSIREDQRPDEGQAPRGQAFVRGFRNAMWSAGAGSVMLLALAAAAVPARSQELQPGTQTDQAQAQPAQTIDQIRVIGNRRIPKETILARLFTHVGDIYDPISIERDFNSLWNTGYFDNLRIEREDTEKGVILNIFVGGEAQYPRDQLQGPEQRHRNPTCSTASRRKRSASRWRASTTPTKIKRAETVLKEMLAEHGHQFATIKTEVKTIPPASVQVNFNIKEGPVVKVGKIKFTGNTHLSALYLRRSMKNLKPIGIPYSIIFEDLFPQTFDASKLEEDTERVRQAYRDKGYANAAVEEPRTQIRDEGGLNWFTFRPSKGKRIDILLPIEEGGRYRLGTITFTGNKAVTNAKALRGTFPIKDGDWFNATDIGKGLENLKKAYGALGYINFGAIPQLTYDDQKKTVSMNIDIDEGKQFYVSRIEFQGNTITRDRVIRRELLLDEGSVYNSQLWEYSLLRLNQLEYFEPLKVDQDSEAHQDPDNGTVDLLLKVKEKGKNSIGMNGGISGLSGRLPRRQLPDQQLPRPGRNAEPAGQPGQHQPPVPLRLYPALHPATAPSTWASRSSTRSRTTTRPRTTRPPPAPPPTCRAAEKSLTQNYNQDSDGINFSRQLPAASATPSSASASPIRSTTLHHYRLQHRVADLLPDHRLPLRHPGLESAGRHHQQLRLAQLLYDTVSNPCARAPASSLRPSSRSPACGAMCATSRRWWPTSATSPCTT